MLLEFSKLPATDEKAEIERQYLADEIGSIDFLIKAQNYLDKVNAA